MNDLSRRPRGLPYFAPRHGRCPAILNADAPITEKLVCGEPIAAGSQWCASCRADFTVPTPRLRIKQGEIALA